MMMHHHTKCAWLQKVQLFRIYCLDKHSLIFWTLTVPLTLNAVIQFLHKDTPANNDLLSNQVWLQKDQQFTKYSRIVIFWSYETLLWHWPSKYTNQSLHKTLPLMMMHHHTKPGYKNVWWFRRYCLDKHSLTFWTFTVTLTLNTAIQFSHTTPRLVTTYHQTKTGCKKISIAEDTVETVNFWLHKPILWPWPRS